MMVIDLARILAKWMQHENLVWEARWRYRVEMETPAEDEMLQVL
jgi:chitodextrinase